MNFPTPLKMQTSWAEKASEHYNPDCTMAMCFPEQKKEERKDGQTDITRTSSNSWMPTAQCTWHRAAWCFQASPSLRSLVAGNGDFQWGLATGTLTSPSVAPRGTEPKAFGFKYEDCTSRQPKLAPLEICFLQHLCEGLDTSVDTVSEFASTGLLQCYHTGEVKGTMVLQQHRDKRVKPLAAALTQLLTPCSPQDPFHPSAHKTRLACPQKTSWW